MALSMFLKIDGIRGESTDDKHKGEIEVLSFSWGEINLAEASGGTAGKVQVHPFHFTASSSQASPPLFLACASGKHFKEAVLSLARAVGDQGYDFMTWTLHNVLVSAYRVSGAQAGQAPVDEIELSFEKVEVRYQPFEPSGLTGEEVKAGWDLKLNKAV